MWAAEGYQFSSKLSYYEGLLPIDIVNIFNLFVDEDW